MVTKRYGNQKPTQSVILPYKKSYGSEAIKLYEKQGREQYPWQKDLLQDILAVNDDGLWVHTKVGIAIPRRNGKNEIVVAIEMYALEKDLQVLHTAHRTNTAHNAWEKLVRALEKAGYVQDKDFTTLKAKGNEVVEFASGGRVQFRTRSSVGGLGEGFDLLIIDEAQEYTDDEQSALKYVVSDSKNPQTFMCGTPPTLVSSGTVFTKFRNQTLDGKSKNGLWAEWGVNDESDVHDVDLWYLTNPSLGYHLTERAIDDEITDDILDFNIQRLGLWLKYNQKSAITEKDWNILKIKSKPVFKGKLHVGISYGRNGVNVSMAIAIKTLSGKTYVEAIDCRSVRYGNEWILDFLEHADVESVTIDGASGQANLAKEIKDRKIKAQVILPKVPEVISANAKWESAIFQKEIIHSGQPSLDGVVTNCLKRNIGSQGGFGYKSIYDDRDISLMDSCLLAAWANSEVKPKRKQRIYY